MTEQTVKTKTCISLAPKGAVSELGLHCLSFIWSASHGGISFMKCIFPG